MPVVGSSSASRPMSDPIAAAEATLTRSLTDMASAHPGGERSLPKSVSADVHRYCEAARAGGLKPEQALIRLKAMVRQAYPPLTDSRLAAAEMVWMAVQRCVKAFYGTDPRREQSR